MRSEMTEGEFDLGDTYIGEGVCGLHLLEVSTEFEDAYGECLELLSDKGQFTYDNEPTHI